MKKSGKEKLMRSKNGKKKDEKQRKTERIGLFEDRNRSGKRRRRERKYIE
jgi:hypothetical protein